jgi:hypothetical protein
MCERPVVTSRPLARLPVCLLVCDRCRSAATLQSSSWTCVGGRCASSVVSEFQQNVVDLFAHGQKLIGDLAIPKLRANRDFSLLFDCQIARLVSRRVKCRQRAARTCLRFTR